MIKENYLVSINPCIENLKHINAGNCVEFVLSRAKNNVDAFVAAEFVAIKCI
jgi:hypothetical protein